MNEVVSRLKNILSDHARKIAFLAWLTAELRAGGNDAPIIVGGQALEMYTQSTYASGDIDLVCNRDALESALKDTGFIQRGRLWIQPDLEIWIDWRGEGLGEGGAMELAYTVALEDGGEILLISIEDLMLDRLQAAKHWKDQDSRYWAEELFVVAERSGYQLDYDYLRTRARQEDVSDLLDEVLP